eukprot:CAMPEP_0114643854 /NCGR_PEP_ID=MMETSP0191-20121206/3635_1 /TAXON_ID=126664 /ORGANISM="Sorites sp." /LENGTH=145 /DNA_ID=CAMNT_0001856235 /DNA_START=2036 /DNA_END=2470 /DNA_ORIENTATION=+
MKSVGHFDLRTFIRSFSITNLKPDDILFDEMEGSTDNSHHTESNQNSLQNSMDEEMKINIESSESKPGHIPIYESKSLGDGDISNTTNEDSLSTQFEPGAPTDIRPAVIMTLDMNEGYVGETKDDFDYSDNGIKSKNKNTKKLVW